ncbi:MAG: hypothetical protein ACWA5W_07815 [Phycisphaerales bacterium]
MSLPALAGTPAALDHVPSDAQVVIVVPNVGDLITDVNTVNQLLGENGEPMVMMVSAMIRGMPGLNLDGSMAAVLEFDEENMEAEPEVVFLLPVSDFDAFSDGHTKGDNGVYAMDMGQSVLSFRNAGDGFVVFGDDAGLVGSFDAAGGQKRAHAKTLGKTCGRVTGATDISMFVNLDAFDAMIAEGMEEMEAQGEMVEMMGGAEAAAGFDMMLNVLQTVADDGSSLAVGLNFDMETGISYDLGVQFKDDSTSASYLHNAGNAGKYLGNMPEMEYFFASAFDLSGGGIQRLMSDYFDMAAKLDTTGMMKSMDVKGMLANVKGGIQVMGASDNIMGGLFANTMQYFEVDDADAYLGQVREMYNGMSESMAQLEETGVKVSASMDADPTEINGVEAYGYSFGMDMSGLSDMTGGMGGPNPAMIMGMVFGPEGGPSGYMAEAGDGIVSTFSKDAEFFSKVADAANGNNTMKGNASIAKTASMMPEHRVMETYIAADHLVNTAGPMLMMFGVIPEFEPVDALAPVGIGVTADGGGFGVRLAMPMETIGAIMEMIPEEALGGGDADDDGNMDF